MNIKRSNVAVGLYFLIQHGESIKKAKIIFISATKCRLETGDIITALFK